MSGSMLKRGVAALAILSLTVAQAEAKRLRSTHCATQAEVTAIAATSIQQELMVAALTCNQIANFNAFQTNFSAELRASDRALMRMFNRLYGGRGASEYHGFKTRLANNSEIRSIHANSDFCSSAGAVFSAALAPIKPALRDVVAAVQVIDASPVDSCKLEVVVPHNVKAPAPTTTAALAPPAPTTPAPAVATPATTAATNVSIKPASAPPSQTPSPATAQAFTTQPAPAVASATPTPAPATGTQPSQAGAPVDQPKKKSGWFSGIFH